MRWNLVYSSCMRKFIHSLQYIMEFGDFGEVRWFAQAVLLRATIKDGDYFENCFVALAHCRTKTAWLNCYLASMHYRYGQFIWSVVAAGSDLVWNFDLASRKIYLKYSFL